LLLYPFPSLTAPKPYQGRAILQKALRAYFRAGHDEDSDVSIVIKKRVAKNKEWGVPIDEVADHEIGMLFVSVTNAIPTLFWMIFYVFRDAKLVDELQRELLAILDQKMRDDGKRECVFNITKFGTDCPLLVSVYQEVMRMTNRQQGTRTVIEDTYLDYTPTGSDTGEARTYLLKKGTNIQMPAVTTNWTPETWGPDVNTFNPKRFITSKEKERQQKRALNPFGGGKHLCPGRHFAYAEILGAVAALVVGFDIVTPEGSRVMVPEMNNNIVEAVGKPMNDVQQSLLAKIRRRPGWEDVIWGFVTGN
jgi:cytochrome P450